LPRFCRSNGAFTYSPTFKKFKTAFFIFLIKILSFLFSPQHLYIAHRYFFCNNNQQQDLMNRLFKSAKSSRQTQLVVVCMLRIIFISATTFYKEQKKSATPVKSIADLF